MYDTAGRIAVCNKCPTCGRDFETRRGLGVHHVHAHDERLPNRECRNCGAEFYAASDRAYCSETCLDEGVSFEGTNNPNYSDATEEAACEICGTVFEYYPSEKEGLYCAECVENEAWRDPPACEGKENPRWNGGRIELSCAVCGASISRHPWNITGSVSVCGDACRGEWLSEEFTGEGHPNWKGGGNWPYGQGWNRVRERALERDGYECAVCGKPKEEIGRNPDVHHIVPVRAFVKTEEHDVEDAHTLKNVVSLCIDCHRKADFGTISEDELRSRMPDE
jgi:hypothetical protein